jgi:hypothetical protein
MLISRCAWHRRYHGYTKLIGVSSWKGLQPRFTDGICQKCAARVRADHLRARFDRGASAARGEHAWMPGLAAVSLAIVVSLVLIARPTHELPPLPPVVAALPAPEALPATASLEEPALVAEPTPPPTRARVASARSAPPRVASARRPHLEQVRGAWSPSRLPRLVVPVSLASAPHRPVAVRDSAQSP